MRKEILLRALVGVAVVGLVSCGGGGGGEPVATPEPAPALSQPAPTPEPTPEPQVKSFEELLSEKLSDAGVRSQIETVADSVKDLETIEQRKRYEAWGNWGLLDNGWYTSRQFGFWQNFSDGTNTIDASDLTAHYVSPDKDGNKLHLISIDASKQIKYLYAENGQKNESARWFTWDNVLSY